MGGSASATDDRGQPSLEAVTNLVLVTAQEQSEPPIERVSGPKPTRAALEGELAALRESGDDRAERACALELASHLIDEDVDLDEAVRLIHRALSIQDDSALRRELAGHLVHMGRYGEAASTLAGDAEEQESTPELATLVQSALLYARAGDSRAAEGILRRAASLDPSDATARERLAALGDWAPQALPSERAADLWLEAAQRHAPDSPLSLGRLALACDIAPQHGAATAAYAEALLAMGRPEAADEVWRAYAAHAVEIGRSVEEVHTRRVDMWCALNEHANALGAALDASFSTEETGASRTATLNRLLKRSETNNYLGSSPALRRRLRAELADAARTKSRMARGTALAKTALRLPPDGRAVLLAVAAESFAAAGNVRRAREAAREALQLAPTNGRVLSTLVAVSSDEDLDGLALERAVDRLPARALVYRLLTTRSRIDDAIDLAMAWARRWIEHSGASLAAARTLLELAVRSDDPASLAQALTDVLNLPLPVSLVGPDVSATLRAAHEVAPSVALDMARDTLDTIGPGDAELAETLTRLAEASGDDGLLRAILVRRATAENLTTAERAKLLLQACRLDLRLGNRTGAASHLWRAASLAADLGELLELCEVVADAVDEAQGAERSECLVSLAHARAWIAEQQDARTAAAQWRALAALRWDLAHDRLGADEAFFMASVQEPDRGPRRYADDLVDRAGAEDALLLLQRRADTLDASDHRRLRGRLLAAGARVAVDGGDADLALRLATDAVLCDPSRSDAVAIVERVADGDVGVTALHKVYDTLAAAALGRFGVRAAHYRAARQLEHRQAYRDGLRHAISAFEAVPSSGAAYALLLRLAAQCGEEETAVRSMASVAATVPSESRVSWLQRAAEVARQAANAPSLRFDLALNAFNVEPCGETVELLCTATEDLLSVQPNDPVVTARFEHGVKVALPRLEGPSGAYTALGVALLAARLLGDGGVACSAIHKAVDCDPGGGGYNPLRPYVDVLASHDAAALGLLEELDERRQDIYLVLDPSLLGLFDALAERVGYEPKPLPDRPASLSWADLDDEESPSSPGEAAQAAAKDEATAHLEDEAAPAGEPAGPTSPGAGPDAPVPRDPAATDLREIEKEAPPTLPVGDLALRTLAGAAGEESEVDPEGTPLDAPIGASAELAAEEAARQRGDHAELAALLARRAERTSSHEMRRLVRLRLAALLEQRLGRLADAAEQLRAILDDQGDDSTTLRYLADIESRLGHGEAAVALWLRASRNARDDLERARDLERFGESLRALPDPATARRILEEAGPLPDDPGMRALRAELGARADDAPQGVQGPRSTTPSAAHAALDELRDAYVREGPGDASHASIRVEQLRALVPLIEDEERELHAFLLAEYLDAADEEDDALIWLDEQARLHGLAPLVAVALAERLARRGELDEAFEMYAHALSDPTDFQQLRSPGVVAVDAAEVAKRLGDGPMSVRLLDASTGDEVTASVGRELMERWFGAPSPSDTADAPAGDASVSDAPASAPRSEAAEEAPDDGASGSEPHEPGPSGMDGLGGEGEIASEGPGRPSGEIVMPDPGARGSDVTPSALRAASFPELSGPRFQDLYDELVAGSFEAGEYLVALLDAELVDGRAQEVVVVRRHQATIRRGDPLALARLADAARAAGNGAYARAVEHVLRAFDAEDKQLAPPPLETISAHPTMTAQLLFGSLAVGVNEALAIVADAGFLRRDLTHYGLTKRHRLTAASDSALGRTFAQLARVIELPGTRLFHRLRSGPPRATTALLTPFAAILDGSADHEGPDLACLLGEALAAAQPAAALSTGLSGRELTDVLAALGAAFGPASASSDATPEQLRLAEDLWHVVTPAAERRLRDICADQTELSADRAHRRVRQACRRAGLFACGELSVAMRRLSAELQLNVSLPLSAPSALMELCAEPAVADLVDFALSEDYAQARWTARTPSYAPEPSAGPATAPEDGARGSGHDG